MNTLRKESNQTSMREEIKFYAWHQIATGGVGSVSLSGIAKSMSISTPALYRYFSSRDQLILALVKDAYLSFLSALVTARDSIAATDHINRFRAICHAYFSWAIDHSQQYQVLFGFSVTPYELEGEIGQIADQCFQLVVDLIDSACQAGKIKSTPSLVISPELTNRLQRLTYQGKTTTAEVMYLALASWSFINGITSLELSQKYSIILAHQTREFFNLEVERFMDSIGFSSQD